VSGVDVSAGASADAPLASANKPAAPNTGMALRLLFRVDVCFARDIGETSCLPTFVAPTTIATPVLSSTPGILRGIARIANMQAWWNIY
jgi:hypothetical protein